MLKVGHTEIFVTDPRAAKRFYVDALGFRLETEQEGRFVWISSGGAVFLLRPGRTAAAVPGYRESASAVVLYTDDLEREVARLEDRGVRFEGHDGSDRCPTFADPDGNWFQLVNPADH